MLKTQFDRQSACGYLANQDSVRKNKEGGAENISYVESAVRPHVHPRWRRLPPQLVGVIREEFHAPRQVLLILCE